MVNLILLTYARGSIFLFLILTAREAQPITINVDAGVTLHGNDYKIEGRTGHEFLGIPFAEPPLKELRFAKPKPLQNKWARTDLTKPRSICMQAKSFLYSRFHEQVKITSHLTIPEVDEDCLYLNIWKPNTSGDEIKSVIVYIHGGSYIFGESYPRYNGRALAVLGDVVVVTINYRLGVFGFLCLDKSTGGNWGLWDQQMALTWIKENIKYFNGDSSSVTIVGQNAGASSASLHLLNSESLQLFKRVILQSGTSTASWAANPNVKHMTHAHYQFAFSVGCSKGNLQGVRACMRKLDASYLAEKGSNFIDQKGLVLYWIPIVDGEFLKQDPNDILTSGKFENKEIMIGIVENEGDFFIKLILERMESIKRLRFLYGNLRVSQGLDFVIAYIFHFHPHYPFTMHKFAIEVIIADITEYDDPNNEETNLKHLSRSFSYSHFVCPANRMVDFYAKANTSVYYYQFSHRPSVSKHEQHIGITKNDEIPFVFGLNFVYPNIFPFNSSEINFSKRIIREWTTFARTGKPASPAWKPFTLTTMEYFKLDPNNESQRNVKAHGINRTRCAFWNDLVPLMNQHVPHCSQFTVISVLLLTVLSMYLLIRILIAFIISRKNINDKSTKLQ